MNNILIITETAFPLSHTFIYRQVAGLSKKYCIHLMSKSRQNDDKFPLENVQLIPMRHFTNVIDRLFSGTVRKFSQRPVNSLAQRRELKHYVKKNDIKLVHVHFGTTAVRRLDYLRSMGLPIIVSFHGNDASGALKDSLSTYVKVLPELISIASKIILVSPHMMDNLGLKEDINTSIIPYGVDQNDFHRKTIRLEKNTEIHILHSGRLTAKKGVIDLIEVFGNLSKAHRNIRLHILGDGEDMDECERKAQVLEVSNHVTFYGAQPIEKVKELMEFCDIFVLNSRTGPDGDMEGLPNAILEAMSMEMSVVSTYHAGIPLAIDDGVNGFLAPEKSNKELSKSIEALIEDSELRARFGQRAREKVIEKFTIDSMNDSISDVYESVIN